MLSSWDTAPPPGTPATSQATVADGVPGIRASSPAQPLVLQWSTEQPGHTASCQVPGTGVAAAGGSSTDAAGSTSGWLRRAVAAAVSLPLPLLTVSHADGSGYDAMKGRGAAAPSLGAAAAAAAASGPVPAAPGGEAEDDPDTITGVFHRLDRNRAKLRLVQVVFRWVPSRRGRWACRQQVSSLARLSMHECGLAGVLLLSMASLCNPFSPVQGEQRMAFGHCAQRRRWGITFLLTAAWRLHAPFSPAGPQARRQDATHGAR